MVGAWDRAHHCQGKRLECWSVVEWAWQGSQGFDLPALRSNRDTSWIQPFEGWLELASPVDWEVAEVVSVASAAVPAQVVIAVAVVVLAACFLTVEVAIFAADSV